MCACRVYEFVCARACTRMCMCATDPVFDTCPTIWFTREHLYLVALCYCPKAEGPKHLPAGRCLSTLECFSQQTLYINAKDQVQPQAPRFVCCTVTKRDRCAGDGHHSRGSTVRSQDAATLERVQCPPSRHGCWTPKRVLCANSSHCLACFCRVFLDKYVLRKCFGNQFIGLPFPSL